MSSPGCIGCTNESMCVCESGYMLMMNNITNENYCVACNIPACMSCSSDNVCDMCQTNYTLMNNGSSCMINQNVMINPCNA